MKRNKNKTSLEATRKKRMLRRAPDLKNLGFAAGATFVVAVAIFIASFNLGTLSFNKNTLMIAALLAAEGLLTLVVRAVVKNKLDESLRLSYRVRLLGILLVLTVCTGNIFTCAAGCLLLKENKQLEFHMGVYAVLVEITVMLISALNIFKGYVMSTFMPAMYALFALAVFHMVITFVLCRHVRGNTADGVARVCGILLILSALSGNIIAFLMGITVIRKSFNKDEEISIGWIDIIKRLYRSQTAIIGMFFVVMLVVLSIWANLTFDYDLAVNNSYQTILQGPSLYFPFGTDDYGRCVFTRVVFGAKISLLAGICVVGFCVFFGAVVGGIAGYFGGRVDNIIMRIMDIFLAVPGLLLPIAFITALGTSVPCIILALGFSTAPGFVRTVRAPVMTMRDREFVEAARACGSKNSQILFKHVLPNSLAPLIIRTTSAFGNAVLSMSSLSYLGVGVQSHIPEWGNIISAGNNYLEQASWLAIFPGVIIVLLVLCVNFMGDGMRDALDPKLK